MKVIARTIGAVIFYPSWPVLYFYLKFSKRARVVIACGDEVLVVKGWLGDGKWSLPGGGLHDKESPEQAARREVKEEVGVNLQAGQLSVLGEAEYHERGLRYSYYQLAANLADKPALHLQGREIVDAAWIPAQQLTAKNSEKATVETLGLWRPNR